MSFFARLGEDLRDIIKKADLVLLGLCLLRLGWKRSVRSER